MSLKYAPRPKGRSCRHHVVSSYQSFSTVKTQQLSPHVKSSLIWRLSSLSRVKLMTINSSCHAKAVIVSSGYNYVLYMPLLLRFPQCSFDSFTVSRKAMHYERSALSSLRGSARTWFRPWQTWLSISTLHCLQC
jgi:hypothetical protein